tara:strand:- start:15 stop:1127 length:1113 start_codon:yes stop_codon:yes gene_type:complete
MKFLYCIQNKTLEDVLRKNKVINKNSEIIRSKKELSYKKVCEIEPDFIMFPHWSYMVPDQIINNYKCICFHSSPLPLGRGGSPIQNMILEGFEETQVCSLLMERELDAGPIYLRTKVNLTGNLDEILIRIYDAIAKQIKVFKRKELIPKLQKGKTHKFKRLTIKDNVINFNKDINSIFDQIRMLDSDLYPDPFINNGDYLINFSNAKLNDESIIANVKINRKVSIRCSNLKDSKEIWEWRNDPVTRSMYRNKAYVSFEEHMKWYRSKLKDKKCSFFIGEAFGVNAGVVRIDVIKNVGEVSININPKLRGLSLSGTLLKDSINSFISETSVSKLVANIDKKNKASIKIFNNVGFKLFKSNKHINTYRMGFE